MGDQGALLKRQQGEYLLWENTQKLRFNKLIKEENIYMRVMNKKMCSIKMKQAVLSMPRGTHRNGTLVIS